MGRVEIVYGSFDDVFKFEAIRTYVAEFISTLLFVFAGVGSVMAYGSFSSLLYCASFLAPFSPKFEKFLIMGFCKYDACR